MLTFYPEFEAAEDNEIEVILILDLSNSMKGKALLEAKKVLLLTLKHLPAHSLFNIVVFGTSKYTLCISITTGFLFLLIYSQTCIKRSPLGNKKSGLIRQVTS
jgi:hypothetical protein